MTRNDTRHWTGRPVRETPATHRAQDKNLESTEPWELIQNKVQLRMRVDREIPSSHRDKILRRDQNYRPKRERITKRNTGRGVTHEDGRAGTYMGRWGGIHRREVVAAS